MRTRGLERHLGCRHETCFESRGVDDGEDAADSAVLDAESDAFVASKDGMPCVDRSALELYPDGCPFNGGEICWEPVGVFGRLFPKVFFGERLESGPVEVASCNARSDRTVEVSSRFAAGRYGKVGVDVTQGFFVLVPCCASRSDSVLRCEDDAGTEPIQRLPNLFHAGSNHAAFISLVVANAHLVSMVRGGTRHKINPLRPGLMSQL